MMITFVAECEKKALARTRRVLDAFANRIGSRTWKTVITSEGLNAVKKLLRKTASKNTAVSCHWARSRSRSELVWIVGNRRKFNSEGVVPVNKTEQTLPQSQQENDWHLLALTQALTALAALLHDWGKASALFQSKLHTCARRGDPLRHEWVSCLLLNALVMLKDHATDQEWLGSLAVSDLDENKIISMLADPEQRPHKPLEQLPPSAKLIAWLIVTHHRLPSIQDDWRGEKADDIDTMLKRITKEWGYENRSNEEGYQERVMACFQFPNGLLSNSSRWMSQLKKWATKLQQHQGKIEEILADGSYRLLLHHARLCLMLGDHHYSSQGGDQHWQQNCNLFANTDRITGQLKQKLDEHLCGVAKSALRTAYLLPTFENSMAIANDVQALKKRSPSEFGWQDRAASKINEWREQKGKNKQGFFAVNMASTGCGKTFANAKIMRATSDDGASLRYILALGLRTLTLQTGDEYRNRIGLDDTELAVLIGSKAVTELHHQESSEIRTRQEGFNAIDTGSESLQPLLDEEIDYQCAIPEGVLTTVLSRERDRRFLHAPVLACTIDHLMSATESRRGGKHILPSLRLLSSDLVIDEIDDFTGSGLIAIGRLIHLAGMLGRKVMISSATISPDLAEGYLNAYHRGWRLYSQTRDADCTILCSWIDEFSTATKLFNGSNDEITMTYRESHATFVSKRVEKLIQQPAKRKAEIIECQDKMEENEFDDEQTKQDQYFDIIKQAIIRMHYGHHTIDRQSKVAVSFGVVRTANIRPCVDLTKYLLKHGSGDEVEVRVMAYHSQQVLLLRHNQEKHLDSVLSRKNHTDEQPSAFNNPIICNHIRRCKAKNLIFILVATPVEEVGRDHDFDWAVVEPSSYRSIIQLAGRVRRHRSGGVSAPNIALLQYNWLAFKTADERGKKCFYRPGYEEKSILASHDLKSLINIDAIAERLDAVPRIQKSEPLNEKNSLADLEHYVTQSELTNYQGFGPETLQGFINGAWWLTALPQELKPFRENGASRNLFYVYSHETQESFFAEKDEQGCVINRQAILGVSNNYTFSEKEQNNLWLSREYEKALQLISEQKEISMRKASLRYGVLNLAVYNNFEAQLEYQYSDQFGLVKY